MYYGDGYARGPRRGRDYGGGGYARGGPLGVDTDLYPSRFHITPGMSWSGSGGTTPTRAADTNVVSLGQLTNGTAADLDWFEFNFEGAAGTWSMRWLYSKGSNRGIVDVTIDGAAVVSDVDMYNGSLSYNTVVTTTDVTIATSGNHTIRFAIDGKNASSTDYVMSIPTISGVRTGA